MTLLTQQHFLSKIIQINDQLIFEIIDCMLINMEWYTGIGNRRTPSEILGKMTLFAEACGNLNLTLRSGGAKGADRAVEDGAGNDKEIYLPNDDMSAQAYDIARQFYEPYTKQFFNRGWNQTRPITKRFMARNVYQILSADLNSPSPFVVCWTPDGCESSAARTNMTG